MKFSNTKKYMRADGFKGMVLRVSRDMKSVCPEFAGHWI